jgi:hypothetical protein
LTLTPTDPFHVTELATLSPSASDLFQRAFRGPPPDFPRHFVAIFQRDGTDVVAGYVHYTEFDDGVYLCGGLCVDSKVYRRLTPDQRAVTSKHGSLSRFLSARSIEALGTKRAVFAYTGDIRSQRDAAAIGFERTGNQFLFVQWHDLPVSQREVLVSRVASLGPF